MSRIRFSFLLVFSMLAVWPAQAEIIRTAAPDCGRNQTCLYWWPKLPPVRGWHTDKAANLGYGENGMNSLVPNGATFADADVIIYAAATYKARYEARNPKTRSLAAFIKDDTASFRRERPGIAIAEAEALTTADGQSLRSFTYFSPRDGAWERVAYGEEGDFYLVFTISAHTKAAYDKALPVYADLLRRYRK